MYDERLQILTKNEILGKICKIRNINGNCEALSNEDVDRRMAGLGNGRMQIPIEAESNLVDQPKEASRASNKQILKKVRHEQTSPTAIPLGSL